MSDDKVVIDKFKVERENLAANKSDLSQSLREIDAVYGGNLMEQVMNNAATRGAQKAYFEPESPQAMYAQPRQTEVGDYIAQMIIRESANGKERIRFQVRTTDGRRAVETEYRHRHCALMVADVLNETDNPDDRRIIKIDNLCERENELIRELNQRRKMLKETARGNTKKRNILMNFIDNATEEIRDIRRRLGVS